MLLKIGVYYGFGDVAGTSSLGDTRQICLLPGKGTNGADAVIFTARSYGAFIFDMADPADPVELAHYDALEMATGLAVYGDYVYVAAGAKGIMIYDKELNLQGSLQTGDICYDLFIQDGKLYTAEGREGVAIYTVDGLTLTECWRHRSTVGQVTMVRPSATGKFVAVHVGAVTGQIVRVSDKATVVSAKAASQMYHHNVTALVDGRYMGFWANSSSERWYDFGENDSLDTPVRVTDSSSGYTPRAAMTGGKLLDGTATNGNGGNLYVYYECTATITGGAITGGSASSHGGNICGNSGTNLNSNIYGGDIVTGGTAGSNGDNVYGTGYLYIDLKGKDLAGVHTVVSRFICYDSATDTYDGSKAGKLTLGSSVTASPASVWKDPDTLKRYMTIENADGTYEFHRFYLGITKMSLRPAVTGVGYKAVFAGSDEVKARLSSYGFKLWMSEDNVATASKTGSEFASMKELTLRLQNFDVANYGDTPIYGSVFIELLDGTVIESATYQYTLKAMVEAIAADTSPYSETQMSALKTMCEKYADAMAEWDIDNILNYAA